MAAFMAQWWAEATMIAYVLLVAALVGFFALLARFLDWFAGPAPHLWTDFESRIRGFWSSTSKATTVPDSESAKSEILLYTLELGRLATEIEKARASDQPGKMLKITASVQAYDDVLLTCCRTAGVTVGPHRPPLTASERLDAETALLTHGIEW
jgi:hypothetical protein